MLNRFWKIENIVLEVKLERNELCRKEFCFWHWFLDVFRFQLWKLGSHRLLVLEIVELEK